MGIKNIIIVTVHGFPVINHRLEPGAMDNYDEDLIMGFLSALKMFANSSLSGQELEMIDMTDIRWIVLPSMTNELVFFLLSDYSCDKHTGHEILEDIRDIVVEKYRSNFLGDAATKISPLVKDDIADIIDETLQKYKNKK